MQERTNKAWSNPCIFSLPHCNRRRVELTRSQAAGVLHTRIGLLPLLIPP